MSSFRVKHGVLVTSAYMLIDEHIVIDDVVTTKTSRVNLRQGYIDVDVDMRSIHKVMVVMRGDGMWFEWTYQGALVIGQLRKLSDLNIILSMGVDNPVIRINDIAPTSRRIGIDSYATGAEVLGMLFACFGCS
jgi:hypothetical protein